MQSTLVTDTSVVFAALDRTDRNHLACVRLLAAGRTIVVTGAVITETAQLAASRRLHRATARLLASIDDGTVLVYEPDRADWRRIGRLVGQYADLPLDIVDATVVAIAERLEQDTIATLDRRHFSVVRPLHVPAFTLVP